MIRRKCVLASVILILSLCPAISAQPQLDADVVAAVQNSRVPDLAIWIAAGGDINGITSEGNTLLMVAVTTGDLATVDYLISQYANLDAQNNVGATALMIAAKYGHTEVIVRLLEYNADPMIRTTKGISAARFALVYQHKKAYKLLRDAEVSARLKEVEANS